MNNMDQFKRLQKALDFSNSMIAAWFEVTISTVKRWRNGSTDVPKSVILALSYRLKYGPDCAVDVSSVDISEPPRLTVNTIIKAVCDATGLNPEYIELFKALESDGGTYYWGGKAAACFTEANTYCRRLDDSSIQDWIRGLEIKIQDCRPWDYPLETYTGADLNKHIESIDWDV